MELGFRLEDCQRALIESKYHMDQAGSWLLTHAQQRSKEDPAPRKIDTEENNLEIAGIEVNESSHQNSY